MSGPRGGPAAGPALRLGDIQGLVLRGYAGLAHARFLLLALPAACAAKAWLREVLPAVTFAAEKPDASALQLALAPAGLRRLGLGDDDLAGFSLEFRGGMARDWRSRLLGDLGPSAPETWLWGGPQTPEVGALLMLYARDAAALEHLVARQAETAARHGLDVCRALATRWLPEGREHFGFRDGLSQPRLAGYHRADAPNNLIAPGEFVLGYRNEYGAWPLSPAVDDPGGSLPRHPEAPGRGDLGADGSYLAMRQLEQDVRGFWDYLLAQGRDGADGGEDAGDGAGEDAGERGRARAAVALAAKMVGRWPGGAPLVLAPETEPPESEAPETDEAAPAGNDFDYAADPLGARCPLGAHIRRVNPRGAVRPKPNRPAAVRAARRHRLLRRGRAYGPPLARPMTPEALLAAPADGQARGLHFVCLVANLRRQFEFVQQTWMNNPKFNGLYDDPDPVAGQHPGAVRDFTVPARPVRRRLRALPPVVRARGGAYFFLPGRRALLWLAREG